MSEKTDRLPHLDYSTLSALRRATQRWGQKPHLILADQQTFTLNQSWQIITQLVAYLHKHQVNAGDRVLSVSTNHPLQLYLQAACEWLGAINSLVAPTLSASELEWIIKDLDPKIIWANPRNQQLLKENALPVVPLDHQVFDHLAHYHNQAIPEPLPVAPEQLVTILYTSGSCGNPKGVCLTAANLWWGSRNFQDEFSYCPATDIEAVCAPLSHIGGFNGTTLDLFAHGGTIVLLEKFHPDAVLQALAKYRVTIMFGVPTMYWALTHSPQWENLDLSSWRLPLIGGDSLTRPLYQVLAAKGLNPIHVWGMTELAASGSCLPASMASQIPDSIGRVFPYSRLRLGSLTTRIVQGRPEGELEISGPCVFPGYWANPDFAKQPGNCSPLSVRAQAGQISMLERPLHSSALTQPSRGDDATCPSSKTEEKAAPGQVNGLETKSTSPMRESVGFQDPGSYEVFRDRSSRNGRLDKVETSVSALASYESKAAQDQDPAWLDASATRVNLQSQGTGHSGQFAAQLDSGPGENPAVAVGSVNQTAELYRLPSGAWGSKALEDWFATGDLGYQDQNGLSLIHI